MNKKEAVLVLVITFIVIMIWLGYDIFFKTKPSVQVDPKLQTILEPLDPSFNQEALEVIKNLPASEGLSSGPIEASQPAKR